MDTNVSNALAIQASVQSAAASARAHRAECKAIVPGYHHDTATVTEMREYADCVDVLHPEPLSPETVLALKVVIVLSFVVGLVAAVFGWREDGPVSAFFFALSGTVAVWTVAFVVVLLWAGAAFVLGG